MEYLIVFIFGAVIGSFLNVCVFRIPRGRSVVRPRSFCPACEKPIRWFDNVPLVSFLILRGRCRDCGGRISLRYFIVELVTALSGILLLYYFSLNSLFFVYWFFACILIVVIFVDIEHHEIPDVISIPGIFLGMVLMTVFRLDGAEQPAGSFINSFTGILAGGGSMFLLAFLGELFFRKEALGGGDIKLMAMIGAFLGWKLVLLTFFIAPVLGSGAGIFMKIRHKKEVIAYGPYLAIGAIISLLYGNTILNYLFVGF